jgi:hypothetical protein
MNARSEELMTPDSVKTDAAGPVPAYEEPRLIDLGSLDEVTRGLKKPNAKDTLKAMGSKP